MMSNLFKSIGLVFLSSLFLSQSVFAEVGFGKPGEPVNLVVGYQPYYTESWSGVVINGKKLWKKHQLDTNIVELELEIEQKRLKNR
mgnify:CR=1 FL=1